MTFPVLIEKYDSPSGTYGYRGNRHDVSLMVVGTDSDDIAHGIVQAYLPNEIPRIFKGVSKILTFQNYDFRYIGGNVYEIIAHYGEAEPPGKDEGDGNGPQSEYTFDTTGGSAKFTHGKTISKTTYSGGVTIENNGAINMTEDGIEGVEIPVPAFAWTETHYFNDSFVDDAYRLKIRNLTSKWNASPFRGNAAGEVQFLGARGSKRSGEQWQITFLFSGNPNLTNIKIAEGTSREITVPQKKGAQYLWVFHELAQDETTKKMTRKPVTAYVMEIGWDGNPYGDFGELGIG